MRQRTFGVWRAAAACPDEHMTAVVFALPDYGDSPSFFACSKCACLLGVDPDAEHYVGPAWDKLRAQSPCPECGHPLTDALAYPDTFRCQTCSKLGHFTPPPDYPGEETRTAITCWDPYGSQTDGQPTNR